MGLKPFLMQTQIKFIKVPILPELSLENIWPLALQIPGVRDYLPDHWLSWKRIDRIYFWAIVTTLNEDWVRALVEDCYAQRKDEKAKQQQQSAGLVLSDEVLRLLMASTFESSK